MSDLKVSLILQLKNLLKGGLGQVRGDLKGLKDEAKGLAGIKGPDASGLSRYGAEARRLAIALRELKREQAVLGRGLGASNFIQGGAGLAGAGRLGAILGGVGGAGYLANKAVNEAITFEYAMAQVKKKVDGADSPEVFRKIERDVKAMAQTYGIAQVEMAKLVAEAGASGIAIKDLGQFMNLAAKASVGWDMTAQETAQVLAQIKAGSQMSVSEIGDLADMINYLGDTSAAKERDIVEMFQRSAEAARAAGSDTKTTLAFLAGARSMGIGTEIGGRFFGAFTSKMVNPTKKGTEALKQLGLSAVEVKKGMEAAPFETMVKVLERLQKSAKRAEFAKDLFGAEWFDEALRVAGGIKEVEKAYKGLQNSANWRGSLNKGLQIELDTTKKNLDRVKALASDIGDQFARWALPGINGSIEKLLDLMDRLRGRTDSVKQKESGDAEMKKVSEYETSASEKDRGAAELRTAAKTTKNKRDKQTLLQRAENLEKEARELRERAEIARETGRAFARTAQGGRGEVATEDEKKQLQQKRAKIESGMTEDGQFKSEQQKKEHEEAGKRLKEIERQQTERREQEEKAAKQLKVDERNKSGADARRAGLQRLEGILQQAKPGQESVRDGTTGTTWNVEKLRSEIERLKSQLGEVPSKAKETGEAVKTNLTMDLTSQGTSVASTFAAGISAGAPLAVAAAGSIAAQVRAQMNPAASASISPPAAPAGSRPVTGGGATGPRSTNVQVAGIHIHGVSDPDRAAKRAVAELANAIRSGNGGAHHDGVA